MSNVRHTLASSRGETLVEVLAALLVSALAILLLSGAIASATNIIEQSDSKLKEYYAPATFTEVETKGSVSITCKVGGSETKLPSVQVQYKQNNEAPREQVVSYERVS